MKQFYIVQRMINSDAGNAREKNLLKKLVKLYLDYTSDQLPNDFCQKSLNSEV